MRDRGAAGRVLRGSALYLGLAAVFLTGCVLSEEFLTVANQRDVLWQVSLNGILAVGMTLVILTAGIDLSVGSLLSLCSVVCAMLLMEREWTRAHTLAVPAMAVFGAVAGGGLMRWLLAAAGKRSAVATGAAAAAGAVLLGGAGALQAASGFSVLLVLLAVPPVGMVLGLVNGFVIARGRLQPFIVTLAMMISAVGLAKFVAGKGGQIHAIYTEGSAAHAPAGFELLATNLQFFGHPLVPVPALFFLGAVALAAFVLVRTRFGRHVYAVGGNEETARLSGIQVDRVKLAVYAIAGFLAGLAAVLYGAQYTQGKPDAGMMKELDAIAAVVIGGTSLRGGRGRIMGTLVGVLIFGYLSNFLNLKNVPSDSQDIVKGVIIVGAVLLQEGTRLGWRRRRPR
ncbi:MAG: ABC transporter permease [Planctomycetes bacterium]|nr:ABC transporter permease [Planctomycetota bacterium]